MSVFILNETAKLLKLKGFSEPCMKAVSSGKEFLFFGFCIDNQAKEYDYTLPLFQQAQDWLRTKHQLYITQEPHKGGLYSFYCKTHERNIECFGEYYTALNEIITKILKTI